MARVPQGYAKGTFCKIKKGTPRVSRGYFEKIARGRLDYFKSGERKKLKSKFLKQKLLKLQVIKKKRVQLKYFKSKKKKLYIYKY